MRDPRLKHPRLQHLAHTAIEPANPDLRPKLEAEERVLPIERLDLLAQRRNISALLLPR